MKFQTLIHCTMAFSKIGPQSDFVGRAQYTVRLQIQSNFSQLYVTALVIIADYNELKPSESLENCSSNTFRSLKIPKCLLTNCIKPSTMVASVEI